MHNANDTRPVWSDRQRAFVSAYKWLYGCTTQIAARAYSALTPRAVDLTIAQYGVRRYRM